MKKPPPTGLCFPYALRALRMFGADAVVVHARIKTIEGRRIWHAWIEHKDRVYDWQMSPQKRDQRFWVKPSRRRSVARTKYYDLVQPRSVKKYTPEDACIKAVRSMHFGPWTGK